MSDVYCFSRSDEKYGGGLLAGKVSCEKLPFLKSVCSAKMLFERATTQMVWDQGSPTIVCLTRMRENGTSDNEGEELCHQYWRQETTAVAVYHTFEVRLVSEHSWCEDYVVRSFYLKNTKTNETRTVTQFHFKSWPYLSTPASARPLLEFRR